MCTDNSNFQPGVWKQTTRQFTVCSTLSTHHILTERRTGPPGAAGTQERGAVGARGQDFTRAPPKFGRPGSLFVSGLVHMDSLVSSVNKTKLFPSLLGLCSLPVTFGVLHKNQRLKPETAAAINQTRIFSGPSVGFI